MESSTTRVGNNEEHRGCSVIDVAKELLRTEPPLTTQYSCIYTVPPHIRNVNDEAYTPKVISIGPFHSGNERMQFMERHKRRYLISFLERAHQKSFEYWLAYVENLNPNVRSYYANVIKLNDDCLAKVILIDAGFILEILLRYYFNDKWTAEDETLLKPWLSTTMRVDLLLLENQLPFVLLQKIFTEAFPSGQNDNGFPSLLQLSFNYFAYYNNQVLDASDVSVHHFTDMLRIFHLPAMLPGRADKDDKSEIHLHTATELVEAGLKLSADNSKKCLFDLRYSKGVLEIPSFKVDGHTEILFRNLLALEQCHYPYEAYVSDYIRILEFLIDTGKDVDLLIKNGIMANWLGDNNAVADLFNSLWKNITQVNFNTEYLNLYKHLKVFHNNPVNRWRASLKRDYCSTPCQTAATFAAILLLVLTTAQTVFSILSAV
ncbi:hypothetical protein O6P43_014676 [Quillaja saponaria]|uniref:Uncharacterized protein n=1 Tax=Quillaja saponaria TaxID=32244 RepID=A0AAD7PS06_QUISA|nr:hypothetical protein O6P43_014676 [Quillaja saponaria]